MQLVRVGLKSLPYITKAGYQGKPGEVITVEKEEATALISSGLAIAVGGHLAPPTGKRQDAMKHLDNVEKR